MSLSEVSIESTKCSTEGCPETSIAGGFHHHEELCHSCWNVANEHQEQVEQFEQRNLFYDEMADEATGSPASDITPTVVSSASDITSTVVSQPDVCLIVKCKEFATVKCRQCPALPAIAQF